MKHLLTLAAFAALTAAAFATEITVRPNKPWKAAGNGEAGLYISAAGAGGL